MKTSASNKKIRELITIVKENRLVPRAEFQRRLVWTNKDKDFFLDSVLKGFPFPEIYVADGDVDLDSGEGTQLLVDGLQRVNTLVQYFTGDPSLKLITIPPYKELDEDQKKAFLQYDVAVRDLGNIKRSEIVEAFQRINATKYSLEDIEINNAVYSGEINKFAQKFVDNHVFSDHKVFSSLDYRRMGDLRFGLTIIATMMADYFNRDEELEDVLKLNNDAFVREGEIARRINAVLGLIEECGFPPKSRVWRKADLFTVFIELDRHLESKGPLNPTTVVETLSDFFDEVDAQRFGSAQLASIYYKAAIQASNDRLNRLRRGFIVEGLLYGMGEQELLKELVRHELVDPSSLQSPSETDEE
ncbi:DUF262 domain-containing protein [Rhizobium sp. SL86]|uniref:DUF262 domain-containing protein n=1 Tax=Rhizobium sp. SL86 TaxID=2995148 RepID=UPI002275DFAF|nr:DUF262 domain-containing protein [Rhizobium sp. SL86]MCY1668466.1 DUF262 domain-containing protein [Rhizobium sp. SL86]